MPRFLRIKLWNREMKKNINKILNKIRKENILQQYASNHVLSSIALEIPILGLSTKSMELIRLIADYKIVKRIRKKYKKKASQYAKEIKNLKVSHEHNNVVWIFWFQGIENAPYLVKKCYESVKNNFINYDVRIITQNNIDQYIQFPNYIYEKLNNGKITLTHFSDLVRLELLTQYGGIWMDATVFCSGGDIPKYMTDSDLFMFQCLKPGLDGHSRRISSWYISAKSHNEILELTRKLLLFYWKKHNKLIDYFLIHDFFELAIEEFPDLWENVIPFDNSIPHILFFQLNKKFDPEKYKYICDMTPIHKLSYKCSISFKEKNYYKYIVNR